MNFEKMNDLIISERILNARKSRKLTQESFCDEFSGFLISSWHSIGIQMAKIKIFLLLLFTFRFYYSENEVN